MDKKLMKVLSRNFKGCKINRSKSKLIKSKRIAKSKDKKTPNKTKTTNNKTNNPLSKTLPNSNKTPNPNNKTTKTTTWSSKWCKTKTSKTQINKSTKLPTKKSSNPWKSKKPRKISLNTKRNYSPWPTIKRFSTFIKLLGWIRLKSIRISWLYWICHSFIRIKSSQPKNYWTARKAKPFMLMKRLIWAMTAKSHNKMNNVLFDLFSGLQKIKEKLN